MKKASEKRRKEDGRRMSKTEEKRQAKNVEFCDEAGGERKNFSYAWMGICAMRALYGMRAWSAKCAFGMSKIAIFKKYVGR